MDQVKSITGDNGGAGRGPHYQEGVEPQNILQAEKYLEQAKEGGNEQEIARAQRIYDSMPKGVGATPKDEENIRDAKDDEKRHTRKQQSHEK
jgi:hypothetical protein